MNLTAGEIAESIGATFEGEASTLVTGMAGITEAGPGDITFCANSKYSQLVPRSLAAAVIVRPDYSGGSTAALLRLEDPYAGFNQVLRMFKGETVRRPEGIHPTALVHPSVRMGSAVSIGPLCVLEEDAEIGDGAVLSPGVFVGARTRIGDGCYLYPNVVLREEVSLGKRVIIHAGSVIGSDGFGYVSGEQGHEKVPQVGTVIVEDDVEIGANVTIDRGTLQATRIGRGVKIDNLVHVAHNVSIGADTVVVAQVGISGSTQIGSKVTLGGQVGIVGHLQIGDRVQIGAQAGVTKSIPPDSRVSGYPAMDHDRARRLNAYYRKLPSLFDEIKLLKERMQELEDRETGR